MHKEFDVCIDASATAVRLISTFLLLLLQLVLMQLIFGLIMLPRVMMKLMFSILAVVTVNAASALVGVGHHSKPRSLVHSSNVFAYTIRNGGGIRCRL